MYNLLKKFLFMIFALFFWNIFFINFSFADSNTINTNTDNYELQLKKQEDTKTQKQENLAEQVKWFQEIWKALYTITWPLILIAWKFMDNDIVYGGFIWMDSLLWKVWNVMRTFANYLIWFILIFSILTLFLWWKLEQFNPIKIIPQLVISTFLVNASWFLMWSIIDIANITTYAVWTLPLKMANENIVNNQIIPQFWIKLQDNAEKWFQVWIMENNKLIPFCEYKPLSGWKLITKSNCVFEYLWKYYKYSSWEYITLPLSSDASNIITWTSFKEIQTNLWWMVGVLWTMYASIINIWASASYPSWSWVAMIWDVILKLFFLLALLIPLLTLAVILIVRGVLLWMFIVISPIIFLFTPIKSFTKLLWEKWQLINVVSLIFLPVVVVFALSLSFVFLSHLKFSNPKSNWKTWLEHTFWIQFTWHNVQIPLDWDKNITISYKWDDSGSLFANMANTFAWIIENIFAIAFMWIIVFSAFKTSKLTSAIASSINKFSINMLKATPVIPFAWWQSISSLGQWLETIKRLPQDIQGEQYTKKLKPLIDEFQKTLTWEEKQNILNANKKIWNFNTNISEWVSVNNYEKYLNSVPNLRNMKIGDLLKDDWKLSELAKTLKINQQELKDILGKQDQNNKLWDLWSIQDFKDKLQESFKKISKEEIKKLIEEYVLNKDITLLQIDDDAKKKLIDLFNQVWFIDVKKISRNEQIVRALEEIWFKENDIIKLLSNNLQDKVSNLEDTEKNIIRNWLTKSNK